MDESLQELENELKRLTPRRTSAALQQRIASELAAETSVEPMPPLVSAPSLRPWKWAAWSLAGVAAALAVLAAVRLNRAPVAAQPRAPSTELASVPAASPRPAEAASNRYKPVQATTVLYDLKEDGTTYLADQTRARQVRYRYLDTYTWKNPATNASLRWSVPRDEVRFVRASLD